MGPWQARDPALARLAGWGGGGLSIALLAQADPARVPLVLAVGECVVRGLPTAARVSVASRSPLSGTLSEGLVGSDFGRRLAAVADAVRIRGQHAQAGAVLVIEADGRARIEIISEARGLSSLLTHGLIEARLGPCATLSIGAAGERGARIASLAACSSSSAGGGPPHFVGRGGLGAVLAGLGLKAIAVRASANSAERASELTRALTSSPRLEERARGGTLELAQTLAARGELGSAATGRAQADEFAQGANAARGHQHGCQGCPTPCGWVFKRVGAPGQAARFGASQALSLQLGFSNFDSALALLARCDESGLDAKEVGAGLALVAEVEPQARGNPAVFTEWLDLALRGKGPAAAVVDGVHALGLALGRATTTVRRCSVRPDKNLASLLGQCVSARGTDPMRSFPFLAAESAGLSMLRELCAPLELPAGSEDPFSSVGKGRLVGWHEDLMLALDLGGFCAFSASALLADRLASLDALALWIAPRALAAEPEFQRAPGRALLAAGAELARAQRELNARYGWTPADDVPSWARARLSESGMEPEYRAYRAAPASFEHRSARPVPQVAAGVLGASVAGSVRGRVHLRSFGTLGEALGPTCEVELLLPASALEVLRAAVTHFPTAAPSLLRDGNALPAIYRAGLRVEPEDRVLAEETLDLLMVIGGG